MKLEFDPGFDRSRVWAGGDEANWIPSLAGECVFCFLWLPLDEPPIEGVDDSKRLSRERRYELLGPITEKGIFSVGLLTPTDMARFGPYPARRIVVHDALQGLKVRLITAGVWDPRKTGLGIVTDLGLKDWGDLPVRQADKHSYLVGAASVVAKCYVDSLMWGWDRAYPGYDIMPACGNLTRRGRATLRERGPSPAHRWRGGDCRYAPKWWKQILGRVG